MKLIIKEYLSSLKERDELDAILPDLVSQLGLNVFSTPGRGTRQGGVDVGAFGSLEGKPEKVYLFTIKSGDLTRSAWNASSDQALRQSLDDILDVYIRTFLPVEHKDKKIVICICLGGDIHEAVRPSVEGYIENIVTNKDKYPNIEFETWNGDRIAQLILSSFLQENLMLLSAQSKLRKSLALLDTPEISYQHFKSLIHFLSQKTFSKESDRLTALRQMNICLWILYSWGREENNIESAYLSSEITVLYAWDIAKEYMLIKTKSAKAIQDVFRSILNVYLQICSAFVDKVILHIPNVHAISSAVRSSNKIDVNLKLFDLLGRIAIQGIWILYSISVEDQNSEKQLKLRQQYEALSNMLKKLIATNPILLLPLKDDQTIDISIAVTFLMHDDNNHEEIKLWLNEMFNRAVFSYRAHGDYPCIVNSYSELLDHPKRQDDDYRKEVTSGSILYPMIAFWAVRLGDIDLYENLKAFKQNELQHCNFQLWFLDETSEQHFYRNNEPHGAVLSNVGVILSPESFAAQILTECEANPYFKTMSAIKLNLWPLILIGCRHYRLPVPIDFNTNLL